MSLRSITRAASLLGLAALLSACCAYERRAPAPEPVYEPADAAEAIEEMEPSSVEDISRGQMQHWNRNDQWNRHPYR